MFFSSKKSPEECIEILRAPGSTKVDTALSDLEYWSSEKSLSLDKAKQVANCLMECIQDSSIGASSISSLSGGGGVVHLSQGQLEKAMSILGVLASSSDAIHSQMMSVDFVNTLETLLRREDISPKTKVSALQYWGALIQNQTTILSVPQITLVSNALMEYLEKLFSPKGSIDLRGIHHAISALSYLSQTPAFQDVLREHPYTLSTCWGLLEGRSGRGVDNIRFNMACLLANHYDLAREPIRVDLLLEKIILFSINRVKDSPSDSAAVLMSLSKHYANHGAFMLHEPALLERLEQLRAVKSRGASVEVLQGVQCMLTCLGNLSTLAPGQLEHLIKALVSTDYEGALSDKDSKLQKITVRTLNYLFSMVNEDSTALINAMAQTPEGEVLKGQLLTLSMGAVEPAVRESAAKVYGVFPELTLVEVSASKPIVTKVDEGFVNDRVTEFFEGVGSNAKDIAAQTLSDIVKDRVWLFQEVVAGMLVGVFGLDKTFEGDKVGSLLISALQSDEYTQKAARCLAVLSSDAVFRDKMETAEVMRAVLPLLRDSDPIIKVAALKILSNLAENGDAFKAALTVSKAKTDEVCKLLSTCAKGLSFLAQGSARELSALISGVPAASAEGLAVGGEGSVYCGPMRNFYNSRSSGATIASEP